MSKSHKIYAVHVGSIPGVYDTWDECREQVIGYPGAVYQSFNTLERELAEQYVTSGSIWETEEPKGYVKDSISVDAACSGNPGKMEYQLVRTDTGHKLFGSPIYPVGTNNLGEFLAVVKALQYLKEIEEPNTVVYTDSVNAIAWVRNEHVNTMLKQNKDTAQLWRAIDEALDWLSKNPFRNPVVKWETRLWGESKADFGRK